MNLPANERISQVRRQAVFVGRVGILAAALGVGGVIAGLGVATADSGRSGDPAVSTPDATGGAAVTPGTRRGAGVRASDTGANAATASRNLAAQSIAKSDGAAATSAVKPAAARRSATVPASPSVRVPQLAVPAPALPAVASGQSVVPVVAQPIVPASSAQPVSVVPTLTALPSVGSISSAPGLPLSTGNGLPVESPVSWVMAAASRRVGRTTTRRVAAAGPVSAAATPTTGTTTTVTWAWGSNPVLNFNPVTDKLDFGWMQASQFDVTENAGSTQISIVGNNHSYTLQGVAVSQLAMTNILAKDSSTVGKWQNLIATAQASSTPTVSVANATVAEGNSGTTDAAFAVTLSKASTKAITVGYSTADGTATAGQDYTAASGTLTFAPGVTSQRFVVKVLGDTVVEPTETFAVKLANPSGASLGTATATGTVTNDDVAPATPPTVSIANATVAEGNSGTSTMAFTVSLSKAYDKTVSVGYATANGTATAGQDYTAASGTLTFAAGATSQQINVGIIGDTAVEPSETLTVTLSNPSGATIATATATGTITNDDVSVTPPVAGDRWGKSFYAPYVDMGGWPVPDLLAISQTNGGGSLFTAAFMQATPDGKLAWAGLNALEPGATNDQALAINRSIKALQTAGGDVMISLGGQAGTSLAQWGSTHGMTATQLATAYAGVIDTYGITHLDFDIEGAAVADPASIALNSAALKILQQTKPTVQVWYTLPVLPTGLTADGINVVDSALKAGVKLAGVNVMAMDYGESAAPTSGAAAKTMGAYAIASAESTYGQLTKLYSSYGQSFGYSQLGVTPMLGVNDVTSEVFTLADAQAVEDYARTKGVGMLALWSVTRDTPGQLGVSTYTHSGMSAPAGSFAKIFDDYGTVNTLNYGSTGGGTTGGGTTGGSTTPVSGGTTTAIGWHWGTNAVLNFNPAADKLDFGWMQPTSFDLTQNSGSTVITIVNNNQTYTLSGVTLGQMQMGNIVALDSNTLAKWQAAISAAVSKL